MSSITMDLLQSKIKETIESEYSPNENEGIEVYLDYRDTLSDLTLREISEADNPREYFEDKLSECETNYALEYGEDELEKLIKENFTKEEEEFFEENSDEIWDWIRDNWFFYYDQNHYNESVNVNLMLDTGDLNYDFTCNNILNYCNYYRDEEKDKNSSIFWLARQFKKFTKLKKAIEIQFCEDGELIDREKESDPFIESVIQELENLSSHMSTLTFLLKMNLLEYLNLMEAIKSEQDLNEFDIYKDRKGTGYLVISKDTMCGLFNPWSGGGSVLEIKLPDDLKIPFKAIWDVEIETGKSKYGYSVNDVYGLIGSCWDGTVKEIHSMDEKKN